MTLFKKILTYVVIVLIALICALNYELFIFPNRFAPAGLNGICTMIQYIFGINIGYMSMIINVPLALIVYFLVSKPLAIRSMVYVGTFSLASIMLDYVDLSEFVYYTESGTSTILGPLVAGIIFGGCYSLLLQASAYSGGTDFVAAIIHKLHHSATLVPGRGMYLNKEVSMLFVVVNNNQVAKLSAICRQYPNTFAIIDPVSEVMGNFKKIASSGKQEKQLLDAGDGKAV